MTTLQLPSIDSLNAAASSLSVTATPAEQRALIKAQYHLNRGIEIVVVPGALLIPSATSNALYRVAADGSCSCPAVGGCWHVAVEQIIIEARARPTMPRLMKTKVEADREMAELFS